MSTSDLYGITIAFEDLKYNLEPEPR